MTLFEYNNDKFLYLSKNTNTNANKNTNTNAKNGFKFKPQQNFTLSGRRAAIVKDNNDNILCLSPK